MNKLPQYPVLQIMYNLHNMGLNKTLYNNGIDQVELTNVNQWLLE